MPKYFGGGVGGVGAVSSVFGRIGAVIAALGDYAASLVTNDSSAPGATVADALNYILTDGLLSGPDISATGTIDVSGGTHYSITGPLLANIVVTLGVTGSPRDNQEIVIDRQDTSAFTVTIVNGGPLGGTLLVMPAGLAMGSAFSYAAGDFYPGGNYDLAP